MVTRMDGSEQGDRLSRRALLVGAAALSLAGCDLGIDPKMHAIDRAEVEAFTKRAFPQNLTAFQAATQKGIDQIVRVRFEIAETDAVAFARTYFEKPPSLDLPEQPTFIHDDPTLGWWTRTPGPAGALGVEGRVQPTLHFAKMMIAPKGEGRSVVFFEEFSI